MRASFGNFLFLTMAGIGAWGGHTVCRVDGRRRPALHQSASAPAPRRPRRGGPVTVGRPAELR